MTESETFYHILVVFKNNIIYTMSVSRNMYIVNVYIFVYSINTISRRKFSLAKHESINYVKRCIEMIKTLTSRQ